MPALRTLPIDASYRPVVAGIPAIRLLSYGGSVVHGPNWRSTVHNGFWRLYWNLDPGAEIVLPTGPVSLPARRPIIIPASCPGYSRARRPVRHIYLHFEPLGIGRLAGLSPVLILPSRARWSALLDQLPVAPPLPTEFGWHLQVMLSEAMLAVLADAPRAGQEPTAREAHERVAPAVAWIEAHPGERISLARLAATCDLGRDRFASLFRLAHGVTPMRHVLERRIAVAADRLLRGEETVDSVARQVGFADRFHFSRAFFSVFHVHPGRFRRNR